MVNLKISKEMVQARTTKKRIIRKPLTVLPEPVPEKIPAQPTRYIEGVGRRKTSVARVRIYPERKGGGTYVNEKTVETYFSSPFLQKKALEPLKSSNIEGVDISVKVSGGGIVSQAEAIRHGIARALVEFNPELRKRLKREGFLKRDPRMKERKKPGLKRARRAPQWAKR